MQIQMIIPNLDNDGSDNAAVLEDHISRMCKLFGGATVYQAKGYWVNEAGRLFADDVSVIVSADLSGSDRWMEMRALARDVLAATDQEAVFVSIGGKAEIIE